MPTLLYKTFLAKIVIVKVVSMLAESVDTFLLINMCMVAEN